MIKRFAYSTVGATLIGVSSVAALIGAGFVSTIWEK